MFKNLLILASVLICRGLLCLGQENAIRVDYGFTHNPSSEMLKSAESNQMLYDAIQSAVIGADLITIKLDIINNEAIAYIEESMDFDNNHMKTAIAASGHKESIYTNLKTCEVLVYANENIFEKGKFYYVEDKLSLQWKLTNETKEILGYTCFKAETNIISDNLKKNKVIAWFSPDIPIQFGPRGYAKLPGLILELEEGTSVFIAKNINFNQKIEKPIKAPSGIRLTKQEYQQKSSEIIEAMRRKF